ncbi:tyrosine-type recombinase/integrase [Bacillus cereus]|uniref:tyrosine-type recombinase/integrase n=1 Tax=Bacillus cereus TaxID=1396 RepID=UPI0024065241|nr:tyrosine-type recombinase/integrase [Bacillus cereus]MCU5283298.1 tyrosine-type recombinase/integrase [Bacillus cereus]MDF9599301.1 tyrosine-type recombinase/integrase [Bacillus cereus]MDG1589632.1 tyrosine-type recombinase/integrase [Bacillus cereus]
MLHSFNIERSIEDFLLYLEGLRYAPNTIKSYRFDLEGFFTFAIPHNKSMDFEFKRLEQLLLLYINSLRVYNNTSEYEISTLNRKRACFRKYIKFLNKWEYISSDFSHKIESMKNKKNPNKDILNHEEVAKVQYYLDSIQTSPWLTPKKQEKYIRNRFIFYTLLYSGLRVSELTNLRWKHFNITEGIIIVDEGKGNKNRTIPIHEELVQEYDTYKSSLLSMYGKEHPILTGYLFPRNEKHPDISLTTKTIRLIIRTIVKESSIVDKHISPHNLRHTFASYSVLNNISIPVLSSILGHSKKSITMDIYAHVIDDKQKENELKKLSFRSG